MEGKETKYIIVGAGLTGLTIGYNLLKKGITDFIILEGRGRIGGRILTKVNIDFGATWFQQHHTELAQLLRALEVDRFRQYVSGRSVFIYSSMAPAQYFENDPETAAFRIAGGSEAIIKALSNRLNGHIHVNTIVRSIKTDLDSISCFTEQHQYKAKKLIVTIPPQLALSINYTPALPASLHQVMMNTHTWMSNAMKIGISYKRPFWRENGLSGTLVGHVGAVIELYDHTDSNNEKYRLMGFINEGLRDLGPDLRKEKILAYLEKHLGHEVHDFIEYREKDWSVDPFTSCETLKSIYISPAYGHPLFQETYMDDQLIFGGAETSTIHGGYMDGAIRSANEILKWLD